MPSVQFRPAARQDLADIWDYSLKRWGVDRARSYLLEISGLCDCLAQNIDLGMACDDVQPGYRKIIINTHVIFYRHAASHIEVVRILHSRMDVTSQFNS